jgi:hypothetical protein
LLSNTLTFQQPPRAAKPHLLLSDSNAADVERRLAG